MSLIPFVALALFSSPQAASTDAAFAADLQCVAVLSFAVSQAPAEQRGSLGSGVMYYVGKIDGRRPGYDLQAGLIALVRDDAKLRAAFATDIKRCAAELTAKGETLKRVGETLKALSPQK